MAEEHRYDYKVYE